MAINSTLKKMYVYPCNTAGEFEVYQIGYRNGTIRLYATTAVVGACDFCACDTPTVSYQHYNGEVIRSDWDIR